MIFINFKTYKEASGERAVELTHTLCDIAGETDIEIIACPQVVDLREVARVSDHPVWAQHVDLSERGQGTGWFPPEVAKETGAKGAFLNHSEHKLEWNTLESTHKRAREAGLETLIFANDLLELDKVAKLSPTYVSYEPPELIASKDTSVARAKPQVITQAAEIAHGYDLPLIVGAGVKDKEDVKKSLDLGAVGVVLSSAFVLAQNPGAVLRELALGFLK